MIWCFEKIVLSLLVRILVKIFLNVFSKAMGLDSSILCDQWFFLVENVVYHCFRTSCEEIDAVLYGCFDFFLSFQKDFSGEVFMC